VRTGVTHAPGVLIRMTGVLSHPRGGNSKGFSLEGLSADRFCERVTVAFSVQPPTDLPARLDDVCVERMADDRIGIAGSGRRWLLATDSCFVHREVAERFYQAISPRPVPLGKQLFWRVVLLLARNPVGRQLLRLLRR
jgi:hypothetical protein